MKTSVAIVLAFVGFALHLVFVSSVVNPGFPGVFCPKPGMDKALANCTKDCNFAHNAVEGRCGNQSEGDFTCYCSMPLNTQAPRSGQCLNETEEMFDEICTIDCQCTHGSLGGRCNYDTNACECIGSSEGYGENLCPFDDVEDLKHWFNESYVSLGMADFAEAVLNGTYG